MPVDTVRLTLNTNGLERAFEKGPSTSYFWLRQHMFRSLLDHRLQWLRRKSTRFGRGKDSIRIWKINEAPAGQVDPRWVVYRVSPSAKKIKNPRSAERALPTLKAEAHAGSIALEVHQSGKDIDVGSKWLAVPIGKVTKRNPRSPKRWRERNPGKTLITLPDRRNPNRLFLVEPKRYRGKRQPGRQKRNRNKKVVRTKLIGRFVLVHRLDMKKTLNFYETWDALDSARQKDFANVANRILQDIARGKLT